jgi:signal transduction histidine kinase
VSRFAERTGIAVNLNADDSLSDAVPAEVELALTRILQEALTNIARHAQATAVQIDVARRDGRVCCRIEDNGVGFTPESDGGSFGLNAMRQRAESLGGSFDLSSRPGEGACVQASIPI